MASIPSSPLVDSYTRSLYPSELYIWHVLPDTTVLEDKAISHLLSEFSFSKNAFIFDDATFQDDTR